MTERQRDIRQSIGFKIVGGSVGGLNKTLPVELSYTRTRPYEVDLDFLPDQEGEETVTWVIGRDLLRNGLNARRGQMVGLADVRVGTALEFIGTSLIQLESPDGIGIFEANRVDLTRFLRRTTKIVPFGRELDHVDMDREIKYLLDK